MCEGRFEIVHINKLVPGDTRPDDDLIPLITSIAFDGLVEPLVVRPKGDGTFEIIDGSRRYRAMRTNSKIEEVPCVVCE